MIDKPWIAVPFWTIQNCFIKSGKPTPNIVNVYDTLMECYIEQDNAFWKALSEQDLSFDDCAGLHGHCCKRNPI
ncbi:hypothetical protein TNCT_735481 [Trichonephila clavata]|uniref:Uncharacterized protein n=1 Tax=Trichonephila clavata TaxID=2740835 RepID=A0A8X6JFQ2_TRICU|nr:hypothetical protein TNCT_735481 [Trichonephila clavata]